MKDLSVKQGFSNSTDADAAVRELAEQIEQEDSKLTLVFFSDEYGEEMGRSVSRYLSGTVVGCTTAGQLCAAGFLRGGVAGVSLAGDSIDSFSYLIHPLSGITEKAMGIAADVRQRTVETDRAVCGLLLVDGLSNREEVVTAALYRALGDVPIIGGSAGDMLKFQKTFVLHEGQLYHDAAVFILLHTSHPIKLFKHQHFCPSDVRLVITEADPETRTVAEINGEPAAIAYSRAIGKTVEELNSTVYSRHPLMLKVFGDYYIRSIAGIEPGGGLKFYCAIDKGLVLRVGSGEKAKEALEQELDQVREEIGEPAVILGCDCILRRLEFEDLNIAGAIGQLYAANRVIGFNTYGEQKNSLHINQTFTGLAIAR